MTAAIVSLSATEFAGLLVVIACAAGAAAAILDLDLPRPRRDRPPSPFLERERDLAANLGWRWRTWVIVRISLITVGVGLGLLSRIWILVLIGGLISSLILTLALVPVMYTWIMGAVEAGQRRRAARRALQEEHRVEPGDVPVASPAH